MIFINNINGIKERVQSTFAPVKMKYASALFLLLFAFFNLSATDIKIIDDNNQPVAEAVCILTDLTSGKTTVFIPDNFGRISFPSFEHAFLLKVKCLGYDEFSDTLFSSKEIKTITLVRNNIDLKEVVVTSTYAPQSAKNSVYSFEVIDKDRIEKQGAVNLSDVMTQELNTRVSHDQSIGSSINLQGLTGQNIKFLIDGVPVIGRLNGIIDLSQINLNNIARVEIINGPMSVEYGTDAIGGVINLITKKNSSQKLNAAVTTYYESIGNYNADLSLSGRMKNASWTMSGGRNYFDGWNLVDTGRVSDWKPKEQYFGNVQLGYLFNKLKLNYSGGLFNETLKNKGEPTVTAYYARATDEIYTTQRITNQLNADYRISAANSFSLLTAYSYYKRFKETYIKNLVDLTQELTDDNSRQDTTQFNSWMAKGTWTNFKESNKINYQAGFDISYETGKGKRIENQKVAGDYALFASTEINIVKNLNIKPGIRYAYNTLYTAPLVPSLHLKYNLSNESAIRFAFSRGFRAPVLKELYLYFVDVNHNVLGNPHLQAESSNNFLLHYTSGKTIGKFKIKTEPQLYYNEIKNLITLAQIYPDSNLYSYVNIGKYKTIGVQINNKVGYENMNLSFGFAYAGKYNIAHETVSVPEILYAPELNAGFDYTVKKTKSTLAVFLKYNGSEPVYLFNSDGKTVTQFMNGSYTMLDASVTQKFFKEHFVLTAGIKNLLNVKTVQQYSTGGAHSGGEGETLMAPGQSYFLKLQYNLFK